MLYDYYSNQEQLYDFGKKCFGIKECNDLNAFKTIPKTLLTTYLFKEENPIQLFQTFLSPNLTSQRIQFSLLGEITMNEEGAPNYFSGFERNEISNSILFTYSLPIITSSEISSYSNQVVLRKLEARLNNYFKKINDLYSAMNKTQLPSDYCLNFSQEKLDEYYSLILNMFS